MQPIRIPPKPLPIKSSTTNQDTAAINQHETELFHQSRNEAATKIQRSFRKHVFRTSKVEGIDFKTRKVIIELMVKLTNIINFSTTAIISNSQIIYKTLEKPLTKEQALFLEQFDYISKHTPNGMHKLASLLKRGFANCEQMAKALFIMLLSDPRIPKSLKESLTISKLNEPNDHAFLQIGNLIIDPWISLVLLPKSPGVREYDSYPACKKLFIDETLISELYPQRVRGFIGNTADFLMLMKHNVNGMYVHEGELSVEAMQDLSNNLREFKKQYWSKLPKALKFYDNLSTPFTKFAGI